MMSHKLRSFAAVSCAIGLFVAPAASFAAPHKDKPDHEHKNEHKAHKGPGGNPKAKGHKHQNGKDLVGDKIKQNGKHKFDQHGKFEASVDVKDGKIAGVAVDHSEKGNIPVTKYKTTEKMARGPAAWVQRATYEPVQQQYIDTVWIGYSYIDDYGEEIIYWFPYDMIYDGDTGAIEYWPAEQ